MELVGRQISTGSGDCTSCEEDIGVAVLLVVSLHGLEIGAWPFLIGSLSSDSFWTVCSSGTTCCCRCSNVGMRPLMGDVGREIVRLLPGPAVRLLPAPTVRLLPAPTVRLLP